MKKYFHFKLSPSKRKYAAEKQLLESALHDIENKKHRLFHRNSSGSDFDDSIVDDELSVTDSTTFHMEEKDDKFRYRQLKSRPLTSSDTATALTLSSLRPSTVDDPNFVNNDE